MRRFFRKLRKDSKGNVMLLAGAGTVALIGGAGLGVDTVQWFLWKRQLQQAVDSSALAGAQARAQGWYSNVAATRELSRNANTTVTTVYVGTPTSGAFASNTQAVEVIATTQQALPFSSVFLTVAPTIRARAVAARVVDGEYCMRALAPTGTGVNVSGTANVDLKCGVSTNSRDQYAFNFNGGSFLAGSPLSAVGGISYTSTNVNPGTIIQSYSVAQPDPYASVYSMSDIPTSALTGPCDSNSVHITPNTSMTLTPGSDGYYRICNGLFVQGDLTLNPGVYIIDGGDFTVNSMASITGEGVTFILTGPNQYNIATVDMQGGAHIDVRAPNATDDPSFVATDWYGMLFFQDPIAQVSSTHNQNRLSGDSTSTWDGIIYMKKADLTLTGSTGLTATCLRVVTDRIQFTGEATVNNTCPTDVTQYDPGARIVRVVE